MLYLPQHGRRDLAGLIEICRVDPSGRAHGHGARSIEPPRHLSPDRGRHRDFSEEVFEQPQEFGTRQDDEW